MTRLVGAVLAEQHDEWAETAPGHVAAVRALVFDPLTRAQVRQLAQIGHRITHAIDPSSRC